ncbi:tyrosine-type recombinase/integrase [Microbacterium sp. CIAB417]|uniref:tyrosine-type recombinase/integrase n=1 Tax=Microbacterium sp. CIAB417 TaxID=2860287 RepID=UPI001FAB5CC3|nr:tyrosine-type recombinase/integrase [Microbacterium sp. CIAB417]
MRISTPDEVAAIMNAAEEWFRAFIAFCAFAGLRLDEAAAMRLPDIDVLHRQVRARRQVQCKPGGLVDLRPPRYGSARDIPAPDELLSLMSDPIATWKTFGADRSSTTRGRRRFSVEEGAVTRSTARLGIDRRRVRCHQRAARSGARQSDHNAQHVQPRQNGPFSC